MIEKGASETNRGRPVAFIEAAWRRYTKHSRNKAQEIQGAILPICDAYPWDRPFLGAVLAGEYTGGSLDQLKSIGFTVLHFPYESIVRAFASVGIDARFDESTPDELFGRCVDTIEALCDADREKLKGYLVQSEGLLFGSFLKELSAALDRSVSTLHVIPLFGTEQSFESITAAMGFVKDYNPSGGGGPFQKFEVIVRFSNGDTIDASFKDKKELERFLKYLSA